MKTYLVQIFLPVSTNSGKKIPGKLFRTVTEHLTARFKGLTVYSRIPAEGHWQTQAEDNCEKIMIYEVMVEKLDRKWWKQFRRGVEASFEQECIIVRAQRCLQL